MFKIFFISFLIFFSCSDTENLAGLVISGCTNIESCNYNSLATIDDDSCILAGYSFDSNGNFKNDLSGQHDCLGQCGGSTDFSVQYNLCSSWEITQVQNSLNLSACSGFNENGEQVEDISSWTYGSVYNPSFECLGSIEQPLVINEFLASNDVWCEDGTNSCSNCEFCGKDYVEFMNITNSPLDISGWVFGDEVGDVGAVAPNGTIIEPGGLLLVWFTGESDALWPEASDGLSASGESIWVATGENSDTIIEFDFLSQSTDISQSRCPDGTGEFQSVVPTPGILNCND